MKKLSEVCKIVGVTRRTLQGYADVGLQKPTEITEGGYWLYDETAIKRLMLIQILVEAGYERKTIKNILDSEEFDYYKELDKVIDLLKEKQNRISGMINIIEEFKLAKKIPIVSLKAISKVSMSKLFSEKSFLTCLNERLDNVYQYNDFDKSEEKIYLPVTYLVIAVGCLQMKSPISSEVQECVAELCKYCISIINEEDNDIPEELGMYIMAKGLEEVIKELFTEPELKNMIELQCGEGADEFIRLALRGYCEINKYIKDKYELEDESWQITKI